MGRSAGLRRFAAAAAALGAPPGCLGGGSSGLGDAESISSLTLQRIKGVTFSHLVTNRCLTPGRLVLLLRALRQLHSSSGDAATVLPTSEISICANYLPKLKKRYAQHVETYAHLSAESASMFKRVEADLKGYEADARWHHASVIHGDPVSRHRERTAAPEVSVGRCLKGRCLSRVPYARAARCSR